jgi:competence protein ComFC
VINNRFYELFIEPVLSFIMPALCVSCGESLPAGRRIICESCFSQLPALPQNYISVLMEEIDQPFFSNLFIVYQFSESFQNLIHLFKYQRYLTLAKYFAQALNDRFDLADYDIITSVPLNPVKEKERGYNQSALIAEQLGHILNIRSNNYLIKRIKNTVSQTKLNKEERLKNVESAFVAVKDLSNQKILLIDDVITTGSTINACAHVLINNRAALVNAAALATPMDYLQMELEQQK